MTKQEFKNLVQSKIVLLDGATGSNLQKRGMPVGVCPEQWMLSHPEVVIQLQKEFLEAGSDIILAPTFTSNRIKLEDYGLANHIETMNPSLIQLSKEAIGQYEKENPNHRKVYVAADLTMTGARLQPAGELSFEALVEIYKEQIRAILAEGVDLFIIETMMSLQESRAALLAVKESCDLPVMASLTFQENGRTLYGTDPKTAMIVLQSMGADAVGLNCSTGPDRMHEVIHSMKEYGTVPILAKPNAGLPKLVGNETVFPMGLEVFVEEMEKLIDRGVSIVGGCCGTTPEHIRLLSQRIQGRKPMEPNRKKVRALTTETMTLPIHREGSFIVVGERINPTGKKELQKELREGSMALASKMAIEQVNQGANILDINVGMNGIDEKDILLQVMEEVLRVTNVPLSIDTSNIEAMEVALRNYPGRALINSISLEHEKFDRLLPMAKKYGAMFVLLPLSEAGLPKNLEEKKEIIQTIVKQAYKIGLTGEDMIVDGLVTTIGADKNAAFDTIETIRYCQEELGLATIVGLSNISFGLPERQYINSTFLTLAIQAGLTMAIANPSNQLLMNTACAADLLLAKEHAAENYIQQITSQPAPLQQLSKEKETESYPVYTAVVKGDKKYIVSHIKEELDRGINPQEIIDTMLIPAINEVGRLFEEQRYFLPQLIASAETMEQGIELLEPLLQKGNNLEPKGTIVIATVAGDIHDIGKNLVSLMLRNYGYRVLDLGKDVPTERIIQVAKEEGADIIGLSALMTTTMIEMKEVIQSAKKAQLSSIIIIGGAVITEDYADEIGADGYSPDAQNAVELVKRLIK